MTSHIILFDPSPARDNLLPFTYLRPVAELRVGILTICEKWQRRLPGIYSFLTQDYLVTKFPRNPEAEHQSETLFIAGNLLPFPEIVSEIARLESGEALVDKEGTVLAYRGSKREKEIKCICEVSRLNWLYDIFLKNHEEIGRDFELLAVGDKRQPHSSVTLIGDSSSLFIHPEAGDVFGVTFNVTKGPIYIGPKCTVMEGACLRGPIALCEGATVKMGAKIYPGTTVGPWSKVGGELNNVVFQGYSNKAHDGFLGNAVIGEWCNLGAGCNASNLKNDYSEIKLWNYPAHRFLKTGLQFCGLMMGDHSKAGVNTMLNTATVLGVGVNIYGSGFPRPFLASFSEGSTAGFSDVSMKKFFETAKKVMARRNMELTDTDIEILNHVREIAEQYR